MIPPINKIIFKLTFEYATRYVLCAKCNTMYHVVQTTPKDNNIRPHCMKCYSDLNYSRKLLYTGKEPIEKKLFNICVKTLKLYNLYIELLRQNAMRQVVLFQEFFFYKLLPYDL